MVDIPGIIEGAHEGIGLGHDFLRHVERTRVLVHMIDGGAEDPLRDYRQINDELRMFNDTLASKPQVVAINKTDVTEVADIAPILEELFADEFDLHAAGRAGRRIARKAARPPRRYAAGRRHAALRIRSDTQRRRWVARQCAYSARLGR